MVTWQDSKLNVMAPSFQEKEDLELDLWQFGAGALLLLVISASTQQRETASSPIGC